MIRSRNLKLQCNLLRAALMLALFFSMYVSSLAASTPVTVSTTDQLFIIQGSGAPASSGDYISSNNGGLNRTYTFYIEVPRDLSQLEVDIYDPDIGGGDTMDPPGNRDAVRNNYWNTCALYELFRPNGNLFTSVVVGTPTGCTTAPINNLGDAAWVNLATVSTPGRGHWLLRIDMSSAVTRGDDVNALGIRAHDGTPGPGGTELNIYSESFFSVGDNLGLPERFYTSYPYVTSGCQARVNDFDWDASGGVNNGSLSLTSRTGGYTHTNTTMSANNTWQNVLMNPWTTDSDASDYGIWTNNTSIVYYPGNNNYGVVYLANYASGGGPPTSSPQANSFRFYFPTDAGAAPIKPYLTQSFSTYSGPNPTQTGLTSRFIVNVQMVNPTGSIGPITFSATRTVRAYVPGGEVVYADNAVASQGSVTSQPTVGGSGAVVWNPGVINPGNTATLTYDVDVTPTSAPKMITITGAPGSNGTRATYVDETERATQAQAIYTFGPLCELRVPAEEPTAVTLLGFSAQWENNRVALTWQTAQEVDVLGFNILRSASPDETPQLVNSSPIQAKAMGGLMGETYRYEDQEVQSGSVYYYWLQVDNLGEDQLFGPVKASSGYLIYLPIAIQRCDQGENLVNQVETFPDE